MKITWKKNDILVPGLGSPKLGTILDLDEKTAKQLINSGLAKQTPKQVRGKD